MRVRKQFDGFLSNGIYERFYEKDIRVEEYLDCGDNSDRAALL